MNEMYILSSWPGWAEKSSVDFLEHEAWAMRVRWGDEEARLKLSNNRPRDVIALEVTFDDEPHFLGIGERETFPDLYKLWDRKNEIPQNLVLALIEKECGKLLQLLENSVRRQLKIVGFVDSSRRAGTRGFEVVGLDGRIIASFALDVSPVVLESFGDISAIDTSHPSIRSMVRPASVEYAAFSLGADSSNIESGDYLLAPELDNPAAAKWCVENPSDDGKFHLRSAANSAISFASFVDSALPPPPEPELLELFFGSKSIATGRISRLGAQVAFAVEEAH
jgi:hypothetical protein